MSAAAEQVGLARAAGWVERDGVVYPAPLPDGPPLVLQGPAVVVWHAVVAGGTLEEVVARVASASGQSPEAVADGVGAFVDGLVAAGVLERR